LRATCHAHAPNQNAAQVRILDGAGAPLPPSTLGSIKRSLRCTWQQQRHVKRISTQSVPQAPGAASGRAAVGETGDGQVGGEQVATTDLTQLEEGEELGQPDSEGLCWVMKWVDVEAEDVQCTPPGPPRWVQGGSTAVWQAVSVPLQADQVYRLAIHAEGVCLCVGVGVGVGDAWVGVGSWVGASACMGR